MDVLVYLKPLKRWWWLLVVATLLAGGTSYYAAIHQPLVYQSKTTLLIGKAINEPNPNSSELYLGQQLASIYADMANREPIKAASMQALGLNWLPNYVARALPNTQLIEIAVNDTDPQRAQAVANELAHQLVLQSPSNIQTGGKENQQFIDSQLVLLQQQIKDTQAEIEKNKLQMGTLNSARQIADLQTQITGLETKVTSLQSTYASLLSTTNQDASNSLTIIEPAGMPTVPIGPGTMIIVALASAIGLVLAALGAYLIEALDDSVKDPDEISHALGAPIIGHIPVIPDKKSPCDYVYQQPRSPVADAFRMLRTNLEFLAVDKPIKIIQVASTDVSDGKSTIAANLAFSMAQAEKQVILVDADFRRPVLHFAAGVPNTNGLSDVLRGSLTVQDVLISWNNENVRLLPAGNLPPNPTELLGSKKMEMVLKELTELADVVIIDGPPLTLADSVILSMKVDGVLVIAQIGRTRKGSFLAMRKQFQQSGTKFLGAVLNRVHADSRYYRNYYYADKEKPLARLFSHNGSGKQNGKAKVGKQQLNTQGSPLQFFAARDLDARIARITAPENPHIAGGIRTLQGKKTTKLPAVKEGGKSEALLTPDDEATRNNDLSDFQPSTPPFVPMKTLYPIDIAVGEEDFPAMDQPDGPGRIETDAVQELIDRPQEVPNLTSNLFGKRRKPNKPSNRNK
jgi:non-specific protein-tyrosine kinase